MTSGGKSDGARVDHHRRLSQVRGGGVIGWTCGHCNRPQADAVLKTFVPVEKPDDGVWTTVAVCAECADE